MSHHNCVHISSSYFITLLTKIYYQDKQPNMPDDHTQISLLSMEEPTNKFKK